MRLGQIGNLPTKTAAVGTLMISAMSYTMHRVFCATPEDCEAERQAFHDALGDFNEKAAMARGILFVPVSIPLNMADKRLFQPVIDENIRSCRYYVEVIGGGGAAPQRNFEADRALAVACAADPALPMSEVVSLAGYSNGCSNMDEYAAHWRGLLSRWLESVMASSCGTPK